MGKHTGRHHRNGEVTRNEVRAAKRKKKDARRAASKEVKPSSPASNDLNQPAT